ncbi:hypothetical protein BaRGS_00030894, partial [Batillaria attramentaria]
TPDCVSLTGTPDCVSLTGTPDCVSLTGTPDCVSLTGTSDCVSLTGTPDCVSLTGTPDCVSLTGTPDCVSLTGTPDCVSLTGTPDCVSLTGTPDCVSLTGTPDCVSLTGRSDQPLKETQVELRSRPAPLPAGENIVLFVGTEACYIVEAKNERTWDTLIQNQEQLHSFTDSVYRQIHSNIGLHDMTNSDAIHKYHSNLERTQCQGRTVYRLVYTEPVVGKK